MIITLNEENPRVTSRGKSRFWKTLIPEYGKELILSPQRSIFDLKVDGRVISMMKGSKTQAIYRLFKSELGAGEHTARILSERPISQLYRIEKIWSTIVDCFICYDPKVLHTSRNIFVSVCRKVFKVGAYDTELLLKWWKSFTNFYYIFASGTVVRKWPVFDQRNFFIEFLDIPNNEMPIIPSNKTEFQRLMSFCSARGLPPSSDRQGPIKKFKELTSSPFQSNHEILWSFRNEAVRLGNACKHTISPFQWHFSINHAGSFFSSIEEGGCAGEFLEDFRMFYETHLPTETRQVETIFGPVMEYQNYPRWYTYFRHPATWMSFAGMKWPGDRTYLSEFGLPKDAGIDQPFACQAYYLAYIKTSMHIASGAPIPTRVEALPEGGGKCRVVTMLPWYIKVFMTPFGHSLQDYLKAEYDGNPCLYRKSPAWDAFCSLGKVWHNQDRHSFLVSDMTSCTDAFPKDLARVLLEGFLVGLGYDISLPMWTLLIECVLHPRQAHYEGIDPWLIHRGILMGEPVTKSLLTIFMCCLRSKTARDFLGFFDPAKLPKWFFFHIGGDDHLVHGPDNYLWHVMDTVVASGFIVDETRYGIAKLGFKYLQTPFWLKGTSFNTNFVFSGETYDQSAYCDSLKSKLLSPDTKPREAVNLLNPAIGKAHAISKYLRWSREPDQYKRDIRSRYIWRMGRLLPSRILEPKLSNLIKLPAIFGGLGLAISYEEEQDAMAKAPAPTKILIKRLYLGQAQPVELFMARRITKNTRRFMPDSDFIQMEKAITENVRKVQWDLLPESKMDLPFTTLAKRLQSRMIYSLEDLASFLERLDIQLDDLAKRPLPNDLPWSRRYWHYWATYEEYLKETDYYPFPKDSSVDLRVVGYFPSKEAGSLLATQYLYQVTGDPFPHTIYPKESNGRLYWEEYYSMRDIFQKWIPILNVFGMIRGTTGSV